MAKQRLIGIAQFFGVIVVVHLVEIAIFGGIWTYLDYRARLDLSGRLNIEPSWQALEEYVREEFVVGMTREQVIEQAYVIIEFQVIPSRPDATEDCEIYIFTVGPLSSPRGGRWSICYDSEEHVTSVWQYRYQ